MHRDRGGDQAPPILESPDEYAGQRRVRIAATQRDELTPTHASRLVDEWIDFFRTGPGEFTDLEFVTRTPRRLFDALGSQTQLEVLHLKWGDYEDLSVLNGMTELRELSLRGASGLRDVSPLSALTGVRTLALEGLRHISDLSPLGRMTGVVDLEIGGDWMSPRNVHVDSIGFLDRMPQLTDLLIHTTIVDDRDYSPLLRLPNLERVRVMRTPGMRPPIDELIAALPWAE